MNTEQNISLRLVDNAYPLPEIIHLFLGNRIPFRVNRCVRSPNHLRPITEKLHERLQPQRDFQVIFAFQSPCTGGGASILSAVSGINHNGVVPGNRYSLSQHLHCLMRTINTHKRQPNYQAAACKNADKVPGFHRHHPPMDICSN